MMPPRIPTDCPRCGKRLYPLAATRPQPRMSLAAKVGFVIAATISVGIYWGGVLYFKYALGVPGKFMAYVLLIPAMVPGIVLAIPLGFLPNVLRLRCSKCGWWERYRIGKSAPRWISRWKTRSPVVGLGE